MFITAVPITKLFAGGGWGVESGGHVLRETTSRGQCELVCPSRTIEPPRVCVFITAGPIIKLCAGGAVDSSMR